MARESPEESSLNASRPSLRAWFLLVTLAASGLATLIFAANRMSPAWSAVVLWHALGGLVTAVPLARAFLRWEGAVPSRIPRAGLFLLLLTGGAMTLLALAGQTIRRDSVLYAVHVAIAILWSGFVVVAAVQSVRRSRQPAAGITAPVRGAVLIASLSTGGLFYSAESFFRDASAQRPAQTPPVFAAHDTGSYSKEQRPDYCGRSGCHPNIHRDWLRSAHGLQPADRSSARNMFCGNCHQRRWDAEKIIGDGFTTTADCLACHAMDLPSAAGGGRAAQRPLERYLLAGETGGAGRWAHDLLFRMRPWPHANSLRVARRGAIRSAVCAPCHEGGPNLAQNGYGYVAMDRTFSEWLASSISGHSAFEGSTGETPKDCVTCHMPPKSSPSARNAATGHACPSLASSENHVKNPSIELRIFALRPSRHSGETGQRLVAPLGRGTERIEPGATAELDVLIRNTGSGHAWPSGDRRGRLRFWLDSAESGEPHLFGAVFADRSGSLVRHAQMQKAVARIYDRRIPPGGASLAVFRVRAPARPGEVLQIRTVLETESRGSFRAISEASIEIRTGPPRPPAGQPSETTSARLRPEDAPWFVAYSQALLAEGNRSGARRAARIAVSLAPRDARAHTALGRVYFDEGDLIGARKQFELAETANLASAAPRAWRSRTLRRMGQFEESVRLSQSLARQYPLDAALWFELGRARSQLGHFSEAAAAFERMTAISPNDPAAHLNLMLCYRRLGRLADARREETLYQLLSPAIPPRAAARIDTDMPEWKQESLSGHVHSGEVDPR